MPKGFIYLLKNLSDDTIKIGYTRGKAEKRMKQLSTGSSGDLEIIRMFATDFGTTLEAYLHKAFHHKKVRGEWYNLAFEEVDVVMRLAAKFETNMKDLIDNENYFMKKLQNF